MRPEDKRLFESLKFELNVEQKKNEIARKEIIAIKDYLIKRDGMEFLEEISVLYKESEDWLHYHDNNQPIIYYLEKEKPKAGFKNWISSKFLKSKRKF